VGGGKPMMIRSPGGDRIAQIPAIEIETRVEVELFTFGSEMNGTWRDEVTPRRNGEPVGEVITCPPQPDREVVMSRFVEIRSYNLKPGSRDEFHRLMVEESLPMLERWQVDVVAWGPSLHDEDSYFLIRAYDSLEDRQRSQDRFYGSDEWRQGPREPILALIESFTSVVLAMDDATVRGLRR
jgi:hypothetical protein